MTNKAGEGTREAGSERRLMGSLREALAAAGRSEPAAPSTPGVMRSTDAPATPPALPSPAAIAERKASVPSAAQAALDARGVSPDSDDAPRTHVVMAAAKPAVREGPARTQLIRGKAPAKRADFHQDPVVGWLVVVGGAGLGAFRPIFEGNNTMGRGANQRIPIDFGDETISNEEQAYIRYDSVDRRFLLVPNLAKTNIVAVNDRKPTAAVELAAMDVITIGRTQLVFVPFCSRDFDWGDLTEIGA